MFGAGGEGHSCPVRFRAGAKGQQVPRLRLPGVAVPAGCAAERVPQAPSTRNDIRDCSADPPVSPALLPLPVPDTPCMGSPPVSARPPVPPVPATDGHGHDGASGGAAGLPADPRRPRLHRALHGCPHGKAGAPQRPRGPAPRRLPQPPLTAASRLQSEYISERDARLGWLTGFTGSAGEAIPQALGLGSGGWQLPAAPRSHSLRASGSLPAAGTEKEATPESPFLSQAPLW